MLDENVINKITALRCLVGYLGEKDQKNWWPSSFLSQSGGAFLNPVFPKSTLLARVNGVCAAARGVHDEHIGVGNVFHLFRLPENAEQNISQVLKTDNSFNDYFSSTENAYADLESLVNHISTSGVGPLLLTQNEISEGMISHMAAAYLSGFKSSQAVFPYYRESV